MVTAGHDLIESIILSLLEKENAMLESKRRWTIDGPTESSQTNVDLTTDFLSFHSVKSNSQNRLNRCESRRKGPDVKAETEILWERGLFQMLTAVF